MILDDLNIGLFNRLFRLSKDLNKLYHSKRDRIMNKKSMYRNAHAVWMRQDAMLELIWFFYHNIIPINIIRLYDLSNTVNTRQYHNHG